MQGQGRTRYRTSDTPPWHASLAEINRGDSLALIAFGHFQIWRKVIEFRFYKWRISQSRRGHGWPI